MKKRVFSFFCLFLIISSALAGNTPVKPEGLGSAADPYLIKKIENLVWLSENTDKVKGQHFLLTADIDAAETKDWNEGYGFLPIGCKIEQGELAEHPFTGIFEGNGHAIMNLFINNPALECAGLFGTISSVRHKIFPKKFTFRSRISNLILYNINISGGSNVGALAGRATGCEVANVYAIGNLQAKNQLGGLFSICSGAIISNCYVQVDFQNKDCSVGGFFFSAHEDSRINSSCVAGSCLFPKASKRKYYYPSIFGMGSGDYCASNCLVALKLKGSQKYNNIVPLPPTNQLCSCYCSAEDLNVKRDALKFLMSNEALQRKTTYVNWNFKKTWSIEEYKDRPRLRSIDAMFSKFLERRTR